MDEPFSALDPVTKAGLTEDLLAIHQQLGLTTVLVTHDVYDAYSLSKRMLVLDQGRVLQSGAKEEVFHRPVDATVARLTGIRNLFSGRVAAAAAEGLTVAAGGVELLAPAGPFGLGEELLCCVRPEDVTLVRPDRDPPRGNWRDQTRRPYRTRARSRHRAHALLPARRCPTDARTRLRSGDTPGRTHLPRARGRPPKTMDRRPEAAGPPPHADLAAGREAEQHIGM